MEATVLLPLPEAQMIGLARQLTPNGKHALLRALISDLEDLDNLVAYGNQRMRAISAQRGLDWDALSEDERMQLIDELKHEDRRD
ncbi:MAG: hypothetical protein ABTQ73_10890 [Caldilineales bacterium]